MLAPVTIRYAVRPVRRSLATSAVADLFGLADAEPSHTVADCVQLDIRPGDVVLFVGPSGSGKSSLLRAAGNQLGAVDAASLELPDLPLVDALPGPLEQRLDQLAACGLSEARLLLRTPTELSDGQRYRFRLVYALSSASSPLSRHCGRGERDEGAVKSALTLNPSPAKPGEGGGFVLADEFCAVLDRTLAKVLAFNVRKLASRTGIGFLLATSHDDLIEDLNPDLLVRCHGDGAIDVERRAAKKKRSASTTSFGFRTAPSPIGRTSLGGITAATGSPSSAGSCCSGTDARRSACASSAPRRRASRCDPGTLACTVPEVATPSPRSTGNFGCFRALSCTPPTEGPGLPRRSSAGRAKNVRCRGSRRSRRWAGSTRFSSGPASSASASSGKTTDRAADTGPTPAAG
jgi:hypothetical protein